MSNAPEIVNRSPRYISRASFKSAGIFGGSMYRNASATKWFCGFTIPGAFVNSEFATPEFLGLMILTRDSRSFNKVNCEIVLLISICNPSNCSKSVHPQWFVVSRMLTATLNGNRENKYVCAASSSVNASQFIDGFFTSSRTISPPLQV